ncbi:Histidine kinase family [Alloalcanivorax dieselolei B5]|uniref:Histidine kinase family n=1 Tax=Alcanivorax dieselolei (strain DSM 16502 / CGMCC 1.3690 / MCCC 1A00001 / B-5) TaxID=930169 RepID=K0CL35_ALCDB|nr:sensor histidine kinase [Alloalcanivorax dieselolei]AFT72271.1 Histidine kinase family [Alloalcanivorax dieselolei B5]GGJ76641.1 alginate O-acetyltransferase [Alloalcanivorax dieselolei]
MDTSSQNAFLPDLCSARAVLVVVVVAELMAIVVALVASYYQAFSLGRLALTSLFIQWVALSSAALICLLRRWLNRLPHSWAALAVVVVVSANTLVFSAAANMLTGWLSWSPSGNTLWHPNILINVLIATILAGLVMRYVYVQEQLRRQGQAQLQARLQALQSRIRPHFLFNSMNIIASLISIDPDAAERAVEDLSKLFRASLKDNADPVPMTEELSLCERYINIEQLRLGERLRVNWRVDLDPRLQEMPLLTLQPLLENAIYHGIQPLPGGGVITIRARCQEGRIVLSVRNPKPEGEGHHRGNRMALENVRHRLEVLHGNQVEVRARDLKRHYDVEIRFPACPGAEAGQGRENVPEDITTE